MKQRSITISGKEYVEAQRRRIERRQKFLTIVSIISFTGSMIFAVVPALKQAFESTKPSLASSAEDSLRQQVRGFELVLQREPKNQVALEGLAIAQIKLKNPQGAISHLEKLVKLFPERTDYQQTLEKMKKQVSKSNY